MNFENLSRSDAQSESDPTDRRRAKAALVAGALAVGGSAHAQENSGVPVETLTDKNVEHVQGTVQSESEMSEWAEKGIPSAEKGVESISTQEIEEYKKQIDEAGEFMNNFYGGFSEMIGAFVSPEEKKKIDEGFGAVEGFMGNFLEQGKKMADIAEQEIQQKESKKQKSDLSYPESIEISDISSEKNELVGVLTEGLEKSLSADAYADLGDLDTAQSLLTESLKILKENVEQADSAMLDFVVTENIKDKTPKSLKDASTILNALFQRHINVISKFSPSEKEGIEI